MEEMVRKINAVHATNQEIIARVENTAEVVTYRYYVSKQDGAPNEVVLEEEAIHTDVKDIIEEFRFAGELRTDLWDVFIITPRPRTWIDLKKLNNRLHAAVKDFELLKDSDRMQKELRKYLDNLEIIQTGLGQVEERTISEQSRLIEMQESLAKLTQAGVQLEPILSFRDSSIVNATQVEQLAAWYGRGWKLLYKASRDGWASSDFHTRCDGKGATVTIVRAANGNIFGGYLSQSWHSNDKWIHCPRASLFTLSNGHGIAPTTFPVRKDRARFAAQGNRSYGPIFGGMWQPDLRIASNVNKDIICSFSDSFTNSTGKGSRLLFGARNIQPAELEVYGKQ